MLITLCGVAALAGLLLARTASSQDLAIETVGDASTATIGDETFTIPPPIIVNLCPPDMGLDRFREKRRAVIRKIREIQRYKGFRARAHARHQAADVRPCRRADVLALWRSRLDRVRAREGKWWSPWAYYRISSTVRSNFICIHGYEGAWNDPDDPYWGGLQMDWSFMRSYGWKAIRRYGGPASLWPPRVQIIVADIARRSGRGYYPWPLTARYCGLI